MHERLRFANRVLRPEAIVLTALVLPLSATLLGQPAAKARPSPALSEMSRSIENLSAQVSPAVVQVFASGFRVTQASSS